METLKTFLRNSKKANSYLLLQNQTNVKQTWQVPNETSGTKKLKLDSFPKKLKIKETEITKTYGIAEQLTNFFNETGPNLTNSITTPTKTLTLFRMEFFRAAHGWVVGQKDPPP